MFEQLDLKIGICGEHGGDPSSVKFFHRAGLDYVSCSPFRIPIAKLVGDYVADPAPDTAGCSPFRIPIAKLAAAQAALAEKAEKKK